MKIFSFLFLFLGACLLPTVVQAQSDVTRFRCPECIRYQLMGNRTGRLLTIKESGNGAEKRATYWVYEFLERGKSLRLLHTVELLNTSGPIASAVTDDGRFLLTFDDRQTPIGSSDKDLVVYDLVRKEHTKYSIKDFYKPETISKLGLHPLNGLYWRANDALSHDDVSNNEVYITRMFDNSVNTEPNVLIIDLPSRSVRETSPPLVIDQSKVLFRGPFYFDQFKTVHEPKNRSYQHLSWDWANKNGEPSFRTVDQPPFPKYLKMSFTRKDDTQDFWVFARSDDDTEYYHRIDSKQVANYVWAFDRPTDTPLRELKIEKGD